MSRQLQDDYGIPIKLDTTALEEIGINTDEPVTVNLHNISLRSALRLMLKDLQLTYIIQDEVLMITTPEEAEANLVVKVYPVADLVLPIDATTLGGGRRRRHRRPAGRRPAGRWRRLWRRWPGRRRFRWRRWRWFGGGGGGGLFSVPDDADKTEAAAPTKTSSSKPAARTLLRSRSRRQKRQESRAIAIDASQSPDDFWNAYFAASEPIRPPSAKRSAN